MKRVYIKQLRDVGQKDVKHVGGKAASLGEMLSAGMPVPDGFVITTVAFHAGMSPELEHEIMQAFDGLNSVRVAVRSSAVAEDSVSASWAGQLETYLNTDQNSLINAVQKCWKSIQSEHATTYAKEHDVGEDQRAVAVVVQTMVDSDVSGVLFTANPVTENRDEIIIEAAYGLGELLVQGMITPENIIVEKSGGMLLHRQISKQRTMMVYKDGENQELPVPAPKQGKPIITNQQVKQLSNLAVKIEQRYGKPQDIEWAITDGSVYIVQSRPITTLSEPEPVKSIDWVTAVARRHTPLFLSLAISGQAREQISKQTDLPIEFTNIRRDGLAFQFDKDELATARSIIHDEVSKNGLAFFDVYADRCLKSCHQLLDTAKSIGEHKTKKSDLSSLSSYFDSANSHASHLLIMITVQNELEDYLKSFVSKRISNSKQAEQIMSALKVTVERNDEVLNATSLLALGALIQASVSDYKDWITADPDELAFWNANELSYIWDSIAEYIGEFGWMGRMYYAGNAISSRDVVVRLQNILREDCAKQLDKIDTHRKQQLAERKAAIATLKNDKEARLLADIVARYMYLRTYRLNVFFMAHEYMLDTLNSAAHTLGLSGIDDVIYLTWQEIIEGLKSTVSAIELQSKVTERRKGFSFLTSSGHTEWFAVKAKAAPKTKGEIVADSTLTGVTANRGNYQGKARLILSDKAMLEMIPGEVLVTTMTTPSLMLAVEKAGAIVTDEGGMLCHAAIVSREFDIPCVIGTETATQTIQDSDLVKVDANVGLVTLTKRGIGSSKR